MAMGGRIFGVALLAGAGAAAVGVIVAAPIILRQARPLLRAGAKRGMALYAKARSAVAELAEDVEDLVAEVKDDLSSDLPAEPNTPVNLVNDAKEA